MQTNKIYIRFFFYLWMLFALPVFATGKINGATDAYRQKVADFYGLSADKNLTLLHVSGYQQSLDYTCGPSAVMSLMHYYGFLTDAEMNEKTEKRIANEMGTNEKNGTSPQQIANWLKKNGWQVINGKDGTIQLLQNNLKNGIPTLIEWIDWGGHWVVVTGYYKGGHQPTDDKDTILFADPSAKYQNLKYMDGISTFNPDRLNSMWFDAQYFNPGHIVKGVYIIAIPKNGLAHKLNK